MNYWVISDTHFGHEMLVKKGYRLEGYEERILRALETTVKDGDVLIHLGDVAFYKIDHWTHQLMERCAETSHTKMWLVRGNHDKKSATWYMERGWDFVGEALTLQMFGVKMLFTHRPSPIGDHDFNIHGHLHTNTMRHEEYQQEADAQHILIELETDHRPRNLRRLVNK